MKKFVLPLCLVCLKTLHILVFIYLLLGGLYISYISIFYTPDWLPIPINKPRDFIQTKDGSVFIATLNDRVAQYGQQGDFVATHWNSDLNEGIYGLDVQFAADDSGLLYVKVEDKIRVYKAGWKEIDAKRKTVTYQSSGWGSGYKIKPSSQNWLFIGNGTLQYLNETKLPYHDRIIHPGELAFSKKRESFDRQHFNCEDGTVLQRDGWSIIRTNENGDTIASYQTSWFLWPFLFGFTGSFIIAFLWFGCGEKLYKKSESP